MSILNQLMGLKEAASAVVGASLAHDVVRVTDKAGNELFPEARVMRATVREEATMFEHPLEDGTLVADQMITRPVEIQFAALMTGDSYGRAYIAIRNAYMSGTPLIVQTKTGSYENQYITAMPHEETPEAGDSVAIALTFREVEWFTPDIQTLPATEVAPSGKGAAGSATKRDASTVKQGQKQGTEVRSSAAYDVRKGAGEFIGGIFGR